MLAAGMLWGAAALREQRASCAGQHARAAIVRLTDPAPGAGGVVEAGVLGGPRRGTLTIRWPEGHPAHGGTTWVIAGRFLGEASRGVLVARRVRELDRVPRGRGALRDRVAERSRRLFGARAPLVDALVIARRTELDAGLRERLRHRRADRRCREPGGDSARGTRGAWADGGPAGVVELAGSGCRFVSGAARSGGTGRGGLPGGHFIMIAGPRAAALWLGTLAVAWWLWNSPRRRWLLGARIAFIGVLISWTTLFHAFTRLSDCSCLTVSFLDVGQGDAIVLRSPAGHWVLIDGGPRGPQGDAGRRVVVPFLRSNGATQLAGIVATHAHLDHFGGLPAVLDAFDPAFVLEPGQPVPDAGYLAFLGAVEGDGAEWRPARRGDRLELDGVTIEVLSPDSAWAVSQTDINEESVVLLVSYGSTRLLLAGDAGVPTEAHLAGQVGRVTLLKVGHHGSRGATSNRWLDELQPAEAVISVGAKNRYGHPAPETLARLRGHGVTVLRTDERGTITFTVSSHGTLAITDVRHHD
jgi:beta-lactamase superfamily II metal-dependent hydrolase